MRLKRELKSHVRPPSRPPTSRKHEPVVVTEEVPEAVPTPETIDERQRLLRQYEKREQLKTSKVVAQERRSMQCPHCYKTDLHPEATKCHHCGGGVMSPEKAEKEGKGCVAVAVGFIGFFVALCSIVAFGYRTNNVGDVIGVILVCIVVAFLAGGIALSIVSNKGS